MDKEVLDKLIGIGKAEDFGALNNLFHPDDVESQGSIMRQKPQFWYDISDSLATEEIAALIKTFTIAEKSLPGWKAGSVSPVIWLGIKLAQRGYEHKSMLKDWVISHTDNGWLTKRW